MAQVKCSICENTFESYFADRYPNAVCRDCINSGCTDMNGDSVTFSNADIYGGFISYHTDKNIQKEDHICYIKGIKCYADEHRIGGIIIQTIIKNNKLAN